MKTEINQKFNSVTLDSSHRWRNFYFSGLALQHLSDLICLEHHLSVIIPRKPGERGPSSLYLSNASKRSRIREDISRILKENPADMEDLLQELHKKGYEKIKSMEIRYSDGLIRRFSGDVVEFPGGTAPTLCTGKNDIRFSVKGENFHFYIEALPATVASYAVENAQEELATALYSHISDSIFVTIRKYQSDESEYFLTHVIIEDPSQIHSTLANDTYGGERERPSDASKRLGWVVGVNGSNFSWETNRPVYAGVCIKDRKIMEGTAANGMEICLMEDGTLFSPDEGTSGEELLMQGVTDTWSCGDTLLIQDGEAVNVGIQSNQYRYPRTAIGMVEPGEYYLITAGSGHYKGGMTYDEVRDVLMAHGCSYGKCMDGGGSSTLVFEDEVVNVPAEGSGREREVEDFLYFSERAAIR